MNFRRADSRPDADVGVLYIAGAPFLGSFSMTDLAPGGVVVSHDAFFGASLDNMRGQLRRTILQSKI